MTTTFTGEVRIPGSIENGLPSTITLDAQVLVLTAGGTELGRWNRNDLKLRREPDGSFHLTLGREVVLFNPDSPLEFAILSGMPGAGTAPTPAPAPPPAASAPAPAELVVPVTPAATAPPTPAPAPAPAASPPAAPAPAPDAPPPSQFAPPLAAPQASPATPPPAAPQPAVPPLDTQPAPAAPVAPAAAPSPPATVPPAATAPATAPPTSATPPPATAPQHPAPQPAAPPVAAPPPAAPASVEFQLEERLDAGAIAEAPPSVPGPRSSGGASTDFWDGFYAEEHGASAMPTTPGSVAAAQEEIAGAQVEPAAGFQLQDDVDDTAAEPRVGGFGSGLFSEEDDKPAHPPALGSDTGDSQDRSWSYNDAEDGATDRGWSYGDDAAEEETEAPPAFQSPEADREDLVDSPRGSRFAAITGWRPSLPSFSFGPSGLGMRARGALSLLDAILEENGTEDISKTLIIGLGGFAVLLGTVAVLVVLFG